MSKERTISGIKVVVSGETYNEYKGTLQEQLEEKDKEIERLNNIISELEILVECLYLKVILNQEQEELLNKIILGSDKE